MPTMASIAAMPSSSQIFLANGVERHFFMAGGWLPLSVRLAVDLEFTALQLLLMGTAIELGILVGEVPTGVIADLFSRKWSVVAGAAGLAGAQLASGLVSEWRFYLITQFLWGIGWTFISGAEIAWVTDELGSADEAEPLLLKRGRLRFVAVVAGTVFFGLLSFVVPLDIAVIVAGLLGLAWSVALAVMMQETNFIRSRDHAWSTFKATLVSGARITRDTKSLRVLGVALILGGMAAEAMDRLNVRRLEDIGLSEDTSPVLVVGAVSLAQAALAWLAYRFLEHRFAGQAVVVALSTLFGLVGVSVLLLAHIPFLGLAAILMVVQGGMLDMTDPLVDTWTNALAPDGSRATVHSFIGQARAGGEILGGVLLGALAAVSTLPIAWTVAAGLFVLAAAHAREATTAWSSDRQAFET